jgi:hypothetical protein
MKVLVFIEHEGGEVRDATLAAITAAAKLGEVHGLVVGTNVAPVAEAAAKIAGMSKVHVADAPHLEHALAENIAPIAAKLMEDHDALVVPSTTTGRNLAPRVAAMLDVMQVSDIISVEDEHTFTRPIYAGNAIATVRSSDAKKVITVRGTAFEKAARDGGSGAVEKVEAGADPGLSSFVSAETSESERPELTSAKIIVSGGFTAETLPHALKRTSVGSRDSQMERVISAHMNMNSPFALSTGTRGEQTPAPRGQMPTRICSLLLQIPRAAMRSGSRLVHTNQSPVQIERQVLCSGMTWQFMVALWGMKPHVHNVTLSQMSRF